MLTAKYGRVDRQQRCTRRSAKHTMWYWVADGDPIPVPRMATFDDHRDAMKAVEDIINGSEPPSPYLRWLKVFRSNNEVYECMHWLNDVPEPKPMHQHVTQVVSTRRWRNWLRKRYQVRCWAHDCALNEGPFTTNGDALAAARLAEAKPIEDVRIG